MWLLAHGIVRRADLPIPVALFGAAAAAVLVASFVALAAGWSRPRLEPTRESQVVMLGVMVCFTLLGLWLLSAALDL